jgi:hypothetical protein
LGFTLPDMLALCRGEFAGDKDCSENAVEGVSGPCAFDEFHPKKDVKPPAGDLGLPGCPLLSGRDESLLKSSSAVLSTLSLRSGGLVSVVYEGILGIVGDRACIILPSAVRYWSAVVCCRGWKALAERSCRVRGLRFSRLSELLRAGKESWGTTGVDP